MKYESLITMLAIIFFLFSNCQNEKELIFGKSKETKKKERDCDPVLTFFICESQCQNVNEKNISCSSLKGSCYIQRNNICTGNHNM